MTGRSVLPLAAAVAALALGGCDSLRDAVGANLSAPDEFNVVSHEPLQLPESFDVLPAPDPGADRPQGLGPGERAEAALFGQILPDAPPGPGEAMLLAAAGASDVDPGIRATVDAERRLILDDSTWLEDINPIRRRGDPTEVLVDVARERQRLQNNAALGLPANAGDFATSVAEDEEKALLEGLF